MGSIAAFLLFFSNQICRLVVVTLLKRVLSYERKKEESSKGLKSMYLCPFSRIDRSKRKIGHKYIHIPRTKHLPNKLASPSRQPGESSRLIRLMRPIPFCLALHYSHTIDRRRFLIQRRPASKFGTSHRTSQKQAMTLALPLR